MALSYDSSDADQEIQSTEHPAESEAQVGEHLQGLVQPGRRLGGKPVINIETGEKMGEVSSLFFDSGAMRVAAVAVSRGSLLNRETEILRGSDIKVWGVDVILARRGEEVLPSESDAWLKASQIKGRYVVSQAGERIGQLADVYIDNEGRVAGYELSQVFVDSPLKDSKFIPAQATNSMGKDVLVVDSSRL